MMSAVATEQRRKILHHLKALVWCLHQMQTRYDLNLVLYSLDHHEIHPEICESNLGDNLAYLVGHLGPEDQVRLSETVRRCPSRSPRWTSSRITSRSATTFRQALVRSGERGPVRDHRVDLAAVARVVSAGGRPYREHGVRPQRRALLLWNLHRLMPRRVKSFFRLTPMRRVYSW